MKWRIITTGKLSFPWLREGVQMYETRMQRFATLERVELKKGTEAEYLQASAGCRCIALDERGKNFSTLELSRKLDDWDLQGIRDVALWIGGADGLGEVLRQRADERWSFGKQTLMHELALLICMEQIYRVHCVQAGHPYHREG